jgi:hypothetical protein
VARPSWIWKESAEFLGVLGVVGSLIFVAFEIRQNNDALNLQARLERENVIRQGLRGRVDPSDVARAAARAIDGEVLGSEEILVLDDLNRAILTDWWRAYRQVQDGVIDVDTLPIGGWRGIFHSGYPRINPSWDQFQLTHSRDTEFIQWFEDNVVSVVE